MFNTYKTGGAERGAGQLDIYNKSVKVRKDTEYRPLYRSVWPLIGPSSGQAGRARRYLLPVNGA